MAALILTAKVTNFVHTYVTNKQTKTMHQNLSCIAKTSLVSNKIPHNVWNQ